MDSKSPMLPEANDVALKNISFKFRVGEKLAIVGMNGSGKTTLIKLLCRLYDPTDGEILMLYEPSPAIETLSARGASS